MTWYERVEQKRTLLITGVIAICVTALAVTSRRKPVSFDSYWHLQTGLDWINQGLSPWIDHFSFTYAGEAIRSQPFMFQALIAWLVQNFGLESGYLIYKLFGFLLAFVLFALFLKRLRSPAIIYCMLLPLFTLLIELRSTVRPELIGYSFSIVAMMLYHRGRSGVTAKNMLPIAILMLLWTNYHSSILGYVAFFGLFVDLGVQQLKQKASPAVWARWLTWGLIVLGVGFLNKSFTHPVIAAFNFAPEWKDFIQEYQSAALYKGVKGVYALIAIVLTTVVLAARKHRFGYLVVTIILSLAAIQMVRLVTPCGIIILCILASLIGEMDLKAIIREHGAFTRRISGAVVLLVALASLYSSVMNPRYFMAENRTSPLIRPEVIVEYMKEQQISGRIYNEFGIGGYLIYALQPDSKVYIDGRTNILYPVSHYQRFLDARNSPEVLWQEIDKYDIDLAILESDQRAYSVMHEAGVLGLDFVDQKYSLFRRDNPKFLLTGKLLGNPACWDDSQAEALEAEYVTAMTMLPTNSSLIPTLGMIFSYSTQADKEAYLDSVESSSLRNIHQLRFAAYQALSLGMYQLSADLFERIKIWDHREFLSAAMANVGTNNWRKAEEIMDHLTMIRWPYVTANDIVLQYRILETIRRKNSLETIPISHVDQLKEQVELLGESPESLGLDMGLLCAN
jgi:hypothetical protein